MKYTKETLSKINGRFLSTHICMSEHDVAMANDYVDLIESTRSKEIPKAGDRIRYTNKYGDYYECAHIEYVRDGEANVCEIPYTPFIWKDENGNGIKCSTSGGAWTNIPVEKLKYVGTEEKKFCDWGWCGACADGAIDFIANVSVWEYVEEQKYPYTTRTHERMYVTYDPSGKRGDSRYTFFGNHNGMSSKAWETELDFQAWLHTFRGKVFKGNWHNQLIVWHWKDKHIHVSPKEFEAIDAPEDTLLMNARFLRCKRTYDEENYTVNTYYVWYWDEPDKDWREAAMEQNEIRRKFYEIGTRENSLAIREIAMDKVAPINLSEFIEL